MWILITSAEIPLASKASAAIRASQTKCPVATIVTSVPSFSKIAFPIINGSSAGIKLGTTGLPNLK